MGITKIKQNEYAIKQKTSLSTQQMMIEACLIFIEKNLHNSNEINNF